MPYKCGEIGGGRLLGIPIEARLNARLIGAPNTAAVSGYRRRLTSGPGPLVRRRRYALSFAAIRVANTRRILAVRGFCCFFHRSLDFDPPYARMRGNLGVTADHCFWQEKLNLFLLFAIVISLFRYSVILRGKRPRYPHVPAGQHHPSDDISRHRPHA